MRPGSKKQQACADAVNGVFWRILEKTIPISRLNDRQNPPRSTRLPPPVDGLHAKPTLGAKLLRSGLYSSFVGFTAPLHAPAKYLMQVRPPAPVAPPKT